MNSQKRIAADIAECALFVALMVAAAFIKIPFPVPLTFQTVVSVLAGLLLGAKKGAAAMAVYAFMGLAGLPVFAAGGGIYYIFKPSAISRDLLPQPQWQEPLRAGQTFRYGVTYWQQRLRFWQITL